MIVYHAVIDTNVLVSAMLKDSSVPRTIIDCIEGGIVIPVYNESIIQEYREVLSRKYLPLRLQQGLVHAKIQ